MVLAQIDVPLHDSCQLLSELLTKHLTYSSKHAVIGTVHAATRHSASVCTKLRRSGRTIALSSAGSHVAMAAALSAREKLESYLSGARHALM